MTSAIFAVMCEAAVLLPGILELHDLEILELELVRSQLKSASLEQLCRVAAKRLSVRAGTLLEEIISERAKRAAKTEKPLPNMVPRPLPEILNAIIEILNRYVVFLFEEEQPIVIAFWILHTWFFAAFDYTPYLFTFSPAIRSGKTRFFEVLNKLCRSTEFTEGATSAALIRLNNEGEPPTFLLDEMDTVYSSDRRSRGPEAESMRQFLNAGFKRGATFVRCAFKGKEIVVQKLPAFCPKAIAAIGQCLPSSVADRSIPIELERQGKKRKAHKMRDRELQSDAALVRDELEVLSNGKELLEALKKARPEMPEELNDRQQDICEPLLAIADFAGGEWSKDARDSLVKLYGRQDEETDLHIRLLKDIKRVFDKTGADALFTEDLLRGLIDIADDAPWPDWFEDALEHDRIRSAGSKLACHLRGYRIKPASVRIGDGTAKGYQRSQFEKAWERYLPSEKISPNIVHSERHNVTNLDKSLMENDMPCDVLDGRNDVVTTQTSQHKSLIEKDDTQICDVVPSEMHDIQEKNISAGSEQPEQPVPKETRLGHMPLDQMLGAVQEVFPNAKIIDEPKPETKQEPKKCQTCGIPLYFRPPEQGYCSSDCLSEHVRQSASDNPSPARLKYLRQQCRAVWQRATENVAKPESFETWLYNFEKRLAQMRGEDPKDFPTFEEWKLGRLRESANSPSDHDEDTKPES